MLYDPATTPNIARTSSPADLAKASPFRQLAAWRVKCERCQGEGGQAVPAAVAFLCSTKEPFMCAGRHAAGLSRVRHSYLGIIPVLRLSQVP